eukprot:1551358-Prymnesium_polylepis.1
MAIKMEFPNRLSFFDQLPDVPYRGCTPAPNCVLRKRLGPEILFIDPGDSPCREPGDHTEREDGQTLHAVCKHRHGHPANDGVGHGDERRAKHRCDGHTRVRYIGEIAIECAVWVRIPLCHRVSDGAIRHRIVPPGLVLCLDVGEGSGKFAGCDELCGHEGLHVEERYDRDIHCVYSSEASVYVLIESESLWQVLPHVGRDRTEDSQWDHQGERVAKQTDPSAQDCCLCHGEHEQPTNSRHEVGQRHHHHTLRIARCPVRVQVILLVALLEHHCHRERNIERQRNENDCARDSAVHAPHRRWVASSTRAATRCEPGSNEHKKRKRREGPHS